MGEEECQTKEAIRPTEGEEDIEAHPTIILEGRHGDDFNCPTK